MEPGSPSTALLSVPTIAGRELEYLTEVLASTTWGGDGKFSKLCAETIQAALDVPHALLTHSCTAALEMAAILTILQPGDEVIMPSFTFVSTANAIVLRGAIPVFVDIRPDTQNVDETLIEMAITQRTRAIIVVHYAGVCCEMDEINRVAARYGLLVIEDAAHAYLAAYRGRPAGSLGDMAAISFHETKNVISGEGGAFVTMRADLAAGGEIVRDKGTERSRFLRGEISQYSWVGIGSSYLPSELIAAVLYAQLECAQDITARRLALWNGYHRGFAGIEAAGWTRRPIVPPECRHNGHIYYLLLDSAESRDRLIKMLRNNGVAASFHYVPLHNSAAGLRFGRSIDDLRVTSDHALRLMRLPLHTGMSSSDMDRVVELVNAAF
jgi:dTDP-4-amino-4,6-dideoxygalactose transaminase